MAKIKLKLKEKSDVELIVYARNVIIQIKANPFFVEKLPQLTELNQAINELESAYTQNRTDSNSKLLLKLFRNRIELKLTHVALFIQEVSKGEPALIKQSGMEIRKICKKQNTNKPKK